MYIESRSLVDIRTIREINTSTMQYTYIIDIIRYETNAKIKDYYCWLSGAELHSPREVYNTRAYNTDYKHRVLQE